MFSPQQGSFFLMTIFQGPRCLHHIPLRLKIIVTASAASSSSSPPGPSSANSQHRDPPVLTKHAVLCFGHNHTVRQLGSSPGLILFPDLSLPMQPFIYNQKSYPVQSFTCGGILLSHDHLYTQSLYQCEEQGVISSSGHYSGLESHFSIFSIFQINILGWPLFPLSGSPTELLLVSPGVSPLRSLLSPPPVLLPPPLLSSSFLFSTVLSFLPRLFAPLRCFRETPCFFLLGLSFEV